MKLEKKSIEVIGGFAEKTIKASISTQDMNKMWDMLQNPYKNEIGSLIREVTSNIIDSHTEAKVNDAGIIRYSKDESGFYVSFIDVGLGMSTDTIDNIYSNYLKSTKENSNDFVGCFGIGSKSPLSYQDMFYINTRYDDIEYNYIMRKGEEGPEIDLITSSATTERNGTEIKLYIKSEEDLVLFLKETFEQLHFFENIVIDLDNIKQLYPSTTYYYNNTPKVIREWVNKLEDNYHLLKGEHFVCRTNTSDNHLSLAIGTVKYPIDWNNLGIQPISSEMALQFDIGDLPVIQTREDIRYTDKAIKTIKEKIELLKEEIITLYNKDKNIVLNDVQEFINQDFSNYKIEFELPNGASHIVNFSGLHIDKSKLNPYQIKNFPYQFKSIVDNKSFQNFLTNIDVFNQGNFDLFNNYLKPIKTFKSNGTIMSTNKVSLGIYSTFTGLGKYYHNSFSKIFGELVTINIYNHIKLFGTGNSNNVNNKTNKYIQEELYKDINVIDLYILKKSNIQFTKKWVYGIYKQYKNSSIDRKYFLDIIKFIYKEIDGKFEDLLIDYDNINVPDKWWKDRIAANKKSPVDYDRSLMAIDYDDGYSNVNWNRKDLRIDIEKYLKLNNRVKEKYNIVLLTKDEQKELCSGNNDGDTKLERLSVISKDIFKLDITKSYFKLHATSTRNYNKILENRLPESNIYSLTEYLNNKKMQTRVLAKLITAIKIKNDIRDSFIFQYGNSFDKLEDIMKVMNPTLLEDYNIINSISNTYNIRYFNDIEGFLNDLEDVSLTYDIFDHKLWNKYLDLKKFIQQSKINFVNNAYIDAFYFTQTYKLEDTKFKLNNLFYKDYTKEEVIDKCAELGVTVDNTLSIDEQYDKLKIYLEYNRRLGFVQNYNSYSQNYTSDTINRIFQILLIMKFDFQENNVILEPVKTEKVKDDHIAGELEFIGNDEVEVVEELNV